MSRFPSDRTAPLNAIARLALVCLLVGTTSPLPAQEAPSEALLPFLDELFTDSRLFQPPDLKEGELGPDSYRDPVTGARKEGWRLEGRAGGAVWMELESADFHGSLAVVGPGLERPLQSETEPGAEKTQLLVEFPRTAAYVAVVAGAEGAYTLSAVYPIDAPEVSEGNSRLRHRLREGHLERLAIASGENANCAAPFATSYLEAPGDAPEAPLPERPSGDRTADQHSWMNARGEYLDTYTEWACQYAPERAWDGDPATGWVEGAPGPGVGEALIVPFGPPAPLEIWVGYGKSAALHAANAWPREVRVYLLRAAGILAGDATTSSVVTYREIEVVGARQVELLDRNGFQPLPVPQVDDQESGHHLVAVEVLSVYPGSRWDDLVISEIRTAR